MGSNCKRIFIFSFLVCFYGYVTCQDYYESATVSTVSYKNPRVIVIGMKTDHENVAKVVEEKRFREAKKVIQKIRHTQHLKSLEPNLKQIPKVFEVSGKEPQFQFNNYLSEIKKLANKKNVTVHYNIKVQVDQAQKNGKRAALKRTKSKKYNVPLKKKNMRLSNLEIQMRTFAETPNEVPVKTTEPIGHREVITTTRLPIMKYKPIISKVKTNFGKKLSKPVKKNEFFLKKVKSS